jgi:hypothetical protein
MKKFLALMVGVIAVIAIAAALFTLYQPFVPVSDDAKQANDATEMETTQPVVNIADSNGITFLDESFVPPVGSSETVSGKKLADGNYEIAYNNHTITIAIGAEKDTQKSGEKFQEWPVTFTDEAGHTQSFVRSYYSGETNRIAADEPAVYLDSRTYEYVSSEYNSGADPLRQVMQYSGKGLYVWVYEGLYYYDPATGTFGLDFDMIP